MRKATFYVGITMAAALATMSLSGCGRSDDGDEHETAAAPNMVEVAPAEPENKVAAPVVKSAATTVSTGGGGDPQQIDEDAAAVGMTARRTTTTTTTVTTTTSAAAPDAGSAQPAPATNP